MLKALALEKDKRGALIVNDTLAIPGSAGLWALGDCAAVVDAKTKKPCPPTAQFALREAQTLAKNIRKQLQGGALLKFHFDSLGALCVVGHQTACAELTVPFARKHSVRFSGLLASWLGHSATSLTDHYCKLFEDVAYRKQVVERIGNGFEPPCSQTLVSA